MKIDLDNHLLVSAAAPAAHEQNLNMEKEKEPFWGKLVDCWFRFVTQNFGDEPLFAGDDPRQLKSIVGKLKKRAAAKKVEWTEALAVQVFENFLNSALADEWLAKHFTLRMLDIKFEEIERLGKTGVQHTKVVAMSPETAIQELYNGFNKFKRGELKCDGQYFDYLQKNGKVSIGERHVHAAVHYRMQNLMGSNQAKDLRLLQAYETNPEEAQKTDPHFDAIVKRIVLVEWFNQMKSEGVEQVFAAEETTA